MPTHNPDNERIKHRYMHYLREAKRLSEHSDAAAAALSKFEAYTGSRNFKRFHIQQAIGFKRRLSEEVSDRTGEPLSGATILSILNALLPPDTGVISVSTTQRLRPHGSRHLAVAFSPLPTIHGITTSATRSAA